MFCIFCNFCNFCIFGYWSYIRMYLYLYIYILLLISLCSLCIYVFIVEGQEPQTVPAVAWTTFQPVPRQPGLHAGEIHIRNRVSACLKAGWHTSWILSGYFSQSPMILKTMVILNDLQIVLNH